MKATFIQLGLAVMLAWSLPAGAADDLPPLSHGWRFEERDGAALYQGICQGCHMAQGQGATGAGSYPALAGDPRLASGSYVLRRVLHGSKAMPGLGRALDDEQVATVTNYVRKRFGNGPVEPVTPADAVAQRALPPAP